MSQPQVNETRQSGPESKEAHPAQAIHLLPQPGGPIYDPAMGYENPGATPNLRGMEPNTAMHRGTPNPEQSGSAGHINGQDHNPGKGQSGNVHNHQVSSDHPVPQSERSGAAAKQPQPEPDPRGVRK